MNARNKTVYTAEEVAALLRVNKATVYAWVRLGQITHIKIGRVVRFPKAQIDAIVSSGSAAATKQPRRKSHRLKRKK
jgi:excisionase family DNA binding protein